MNNQRRLISVLSSLVIFAIAYTSIYSCFGSNEVNDKQFILYVAIFSSTASIIFSIIFKSNFHQIKQTIITTIVSYIIGVLFALLTSPFRLDSQLSIIIFLTAYFGVGINLFVILALIIYTNNKLLFKLLKV